MRRITFGLFCCVLAVTGCAPGGGGSSVAPAQRAFAVPQAISRAVPPAPPNFVPKPPSTTATSSVRRTTGAAQAAFFAGAVPLSNGVYYLTLPGGNVFGYYSYLPDPNYIYHFDMGYEYVADAGDGNGGVYLYDFASSHWWYTSRTYEFPYVYDFSLSSVLYYYPDTHNAGHYTTNPRYFYDFATGQIIQLPEPALSTKATQRAQVQALLTVSKVLDTGGYYPGYLTLGPMARGRRTQGAQRVEPVRATCSPGGANGDGSASASSTSDAQGRHEIYSDFYSPNCVNTERITTLNEPTSNTANQGTSTGYTTQYNRAGAVIGYATNQQTYNQNLLTVVMSDAKTVGGAQAGRSGASCVPTSSTVTRCNLASFMTAGGETTGLLETVTETYNNSGTWTAQISATTYAGSGLSLVQPPAGGSTWGIQGGTQIDSLSGSGTAAYNGSFASQLDYTTTSSPGGYSATAHLVFANATLTITVSKNGATVATAVVDGDGNGTVTYAADNSTDTVAGFTIFS